MQTKNKLGFTGSARLIQRSFSFMEKDRRNYLLGWFLASAEMVMAYITPYLYEQLVEVISPERSTETLYIIVVLFVILLLLTPIVCLGAYLQKTSTARGIANMRKKVFDHIQHLSISESIERKTGDYITRLTNDVERAAGMFRGYAFTGLSKFIVYTMVSLILLFRVEWRLAVISILLSGISFFLSTILNPRVRELERNASQETASSASYLIETLRAVPIVRVFLLGDILSRRYYNICRKIYSKRVKFRTMNGISDGLIYMFSYSAQPIGFIVGIFLMLQGQMELSKVVFASSVMGVMADGMRSFSTFVQFIQSGIVSSQRVFELLEQPIEEERTASRSPDLSFPNAVEIRDVRFAYPNGIQVIRGINLTVRNGENIAIVGGSGGGKTTMIKLLQAFYEPSSGSFSLYAAPMEKMNLKQIRELSAYVPQESTVFDATIAENIGFGKSGSSMEEIIEAAKQADIHEYICSLPEGYQTFVGERGSQISGGQRQRIAIARAFLKNAPLLLLDEATAALDSESEAEVYKGLDRLMKGRTTIVIAHRLSTVQRADRIIVIEDGQIVEEGTHSSLMEKNGRYRQLCEMQLKD